MPYQIETMKNLLTTLFITGLLMICHYAVNAQETAPQRQAPPQVRQQPTEKTRRFLLRYITAYDTCKTLKDRETILRGIEMVAQASANDWISQYHAAFYNAIISKEHKDSTEANALLTRAEDFGKKAAALQKDESEIVLLMAMINGMRIGVNPALGATLGQEVMAGYEKAAKLNPENPRVYLVKGESLMYMPEQAGGGKKAAKEMIEIALKKYESDKHDDPAWPVWGKNRATELMASLKK